MPCFFLVLFFTVGSFLFAGPVEDFQFLNHEALLRYTQEYADPDSWVQKSIQKDFSKYEGSCFNPNRIDSFLHQVDTSQQIYWVQIKKNEIFFHPTYSDRTDLREQVLAVALARLSDSIGLPDVVFCGSWHDSYAGNKEVPILAFAKRQGDSSILIPDFEALSGYSSLKKRVEGANRSLPWSKKKASCIWRGSTTGGVFNMQNWKIFPRSRVVLEARRYPHLIDAKFTAVVQSPTPLELEKLFRRHHLLAPSMSVEEMLNYRYLLDVDGNTCGYSRMYWSLLANSALIKVQSDQVQWYYDLLKPYENYVPVDPDLKTFKAAFQWLRSNDKRAQYLARNATELAQDHLSQEATLAYFYHVILKLSHDQREQVKDSLSNRMF